MGRHLENSRILFIAIILFALNGWTAGSVAGKVTIVKGQVFIVRGSEKIQVKKDITVLESDVIESQAGGTARITMIDSNLVDVYPKSKVEIAKYVYRPNQDKKDVELKVDFGKIKSTVNQKYDGAKNKFQVKTPSAVAGVRGTVFTAEYDAVKKVSKVITIEGLVAVTKMLDRERQSPPVFVRPDQVVKVDPQQAKTEQPRDLKTDEREEHKKEDKDLGYQYDPKKEQLPAGSEDGNSTKFEPGKDAPKYSESPAQPGKDLPVKDIPGTATTEAKNIEHQTKEAQVNEPKREPVTIKENPVKEITKETQVSEPKREPVTIKESPKEIIKNVVKEMTERRQQQQQEQQEKRQTASEDEQNKKQKQLEDDQLKKQKQLEDEQAKKQKQTEDEQAKKQKQLEEEQARKQKQLEDEQAKKQKQSEEEQLKKQKQLEEEQARKQKQLEDEQAKKAKVLEAALEAKRKQAEEAQAKREEEAKQRAEIEAARRAEEARRSAEVAKKRAELLNRLPSGSRISPK